MLQVTHFLSPVFSFHFILSFYLQNSPSSTHVLTFSTLLLVMKPSKTADYAWDSGMNGMEQGQLWT